MIDNGRLALRPALVLSGGADVSRYNGRGILGEGRSPAKVRPRCFCQVLLVPGNCPVCHWERGP